MPDNAGLNRTIGLIQDYTSLHKTLMDSTLYKTMQDYTGLLRTIKDYKGLFRSAEDYTGLYRTK